MGDHDGDPKVPDLPPQTGMEYMGALGQKSSNLPSKGVLSFAAYSAGFGGLSLLAWVLYHFFACGCG